MDIIKTELIISEMVVRNAEKLSCHTMADPDTFNSYHVFYIKYRVVQRQWSSHPGCELVV